MSDQIDILRRDFLLKRIKGIAGGFHVAWSPKDITRISDHILAAPERILREPPVNLPAQVDIDATVLRRKFALQYGATVRASEPDDFNFMFIISSEAVDLAGDAITVDGIDCTNFQKNPVVLNSHDSSAVPVAISTTPVVSGTALTAVAEFPAPGVSECSDQIAAALRAKLVKGASIGFVPLKWSFTKDAARPFGIDFHEVRLLEWSVCAVPCNPECLLIGAVARNKSARNAKTVERRREARALAARARLVAASMSDEVVPATRNQRLMEAENFRRAADLAIGK